MRRRGDVRYASVGSKRLWVCLCDAIRGGVAGVDGTGWRRKDVGIDEKTDATNPSLISLHQSAIVQERFVRDPKQFIDLKRTLLATSLPTSVAALFGVVSGGDIAPVIYRLPYRDFAKQVAFSAAEPAKPYAPENEFV